MTKGWDGLPYWMMNKWATGYVLNDEQMIYWLRVKGPPALDDVYIIPHPYKSQAAQGTFHHLSTQTHGYLLRGLSFSDIHHISCRDGGETQQTISSWMRYWKKDGTTLPTPAASVAQNWEGIESRLDERNLVTADDWRIVTTGRTKMHGNWTWTQAAEDFLAGLRTNNSYIFVYLYHSRCSIHLHFFH